MKDEIKEILEEVNKIIDNTSYNEDFTYFQTSHISKLLDYITNLQQKIEKLENDKRGMLVQLYKANDEKDKLKEKIKHYEKTQTFGDYVKEVNLLVDYKTRNEKAIEFVNEFIQEDYYEKLDEYITHFTWNTTKEDLLNKLQGVDKDCTD